MPRARLIRWGGIVAIIGGVLFPVAALIHSAGESLNTVRFDLIHSLRPIVVLDDAAFGIGFAWMGYRVWSV